MVRGFIFLMLFCFSLKAQDWQHFTTANSDLVSNHVRTILIGPDDSKWFGTDHGLSLYDGKSWRNFSTVDGLVNNMINDIASEKTAFGYNLWIATAGGISVVEVISTGAISVSNSFSSNTSGLLSDLVAAVILDPRLVRWFGTNKGVSILSQDTWLQATANDYLTSNLIQDLESDAAGLVHIATRGGGVSRLKIDEFDSITMASTIVSTWSWLLSDTIYTVFIDNDDVQWFGTGEGAFRHTGLDSKINWQVYQTAEGLIDNHVQTIAGDSRGTIWFGTPHGASVLSGQTFKNYTEADGLVSNNILDIAVDQDGATWFATDGGISRLASGSTGVTESTLPRRLHLANFPNPFNNGTTLFFSLTGPGQVYMSIFTTNGQKVREYPPQIFPGGTHRLHWNGCDDHGQKLPTGVYFVSMSLAGRTMTRKLVMLK